MRFPCNVRRERRTDSAREALEAEAAFSFAFASFPAFTFAAFAFFAKAFIFFKFLIFFKQRDYAFLIRRNGGKQFFF